MVSNFSPLGLSPLRGRFPFLQSGPSRVRIRIHFRWRLREGELRQLFYLLGPLVGGGVTVRLLATVRVTGPVGIAGGAGPFAIVAPALLEPSGGLPA